MELTPQTLMDIQLAAYDERDKSVNLDRNRKYERLADAAHHLYCLAALCPTATLVAPQDAQPAQNA